MESLQYMVVFPSANGFLCLGRIFLNYYGIIDYHAIGQEIGDFEIQHDSDFIQQIISEEIESGASRAYMDGLTFTHFRLFETWKKKKILEIVCEKIEVEYL